MYRASIILLLLIAPAVHSQTAGATASEWEAIRACSASADPDTVGLEPLEEACPGLEASLAALGYGPLLSEKQREELSVYSLEDLVHLATVEDSASASLQRASLESVLKSLEAEANRTRLSWWARLENWIRELFSRRAEEISWLDGWLEKFQPSEIVVRTILYSLVVLVILLAVLVVVNELRVAGVFKRRSGAAVPIAGDAGSRKGTDESVSIGEIDRVPIDKRPAVLLRILVAALVRAGKLRSERSLTYRELARAVGFTDRTQRESFERIARAAESSVYGGRCFAEEDVASLVREGRQLQAGLEERVA